MDAHTDPVAAVVLALAVILVAAKLGGDLAMRVGQPSVLGELLAGVLLGNLTLVGFHGLGPIASDPSIEMLAGIGVLLLLFEVGLESTVGQMMKVGLSSLLVAILGVIAPFASRVGRVGVALAARVGLPSHVPRSDALRDQRGHHRTRSQGPRPLAEQRGSRDPGGRRDRRRARPRHPLRGHRPDRRGGPGRGGQPRRRRDAAREGDRVSRAGRCIIGTAVSPALFSFASKLRVRGVLLAVALAFCFLLSWLASLIELAPIVGAFAAGLILEPVHYRDFKERGEHDLEELIHPISAFLVPVFFVLMGMHTEPRGFRCARASWASRPR